MEEAHNVYLDLYEFAPMGYISLNKQNIIIRANLTAAKLLKTEKEKLIKQSIVHFIAPESQDTLFLCLQKLWETGSKKVCEVQLKLADGDIRWVMFDMAIHENKARIGITDTSREIKDLNQVLLQRTKDLGVLNKNLEVANEGLDILNKELEGFSFSVSHDLKTPLRHLDKFSQILLEDYADKLDEKGKSYLKTIRAASQLASQYVGDLLLLSEMGSAPINPSTINLSQIAHKILLRPPE